jgi:hypothetical protein
VVDLMVAERILRAMAATPEPLALTQISANASSTGMVRSWGAERGPFWRIECPLERTVTETALSEELPMRVATARATSASGSIMRRRKEGHGRDSSGSIEEK